MYLSLFRFLTLKFLRGIVILVGVSIIVFLLMHAIPGSPWSNYSTQARMQLGVGVDQSIQRAISRHFGLDLPMWRQYVRYMFGDIEGGSFICGVVCGNLGPSIRQHGRAIIDILFEPPEGKNAWSSRFGYSIRLVLFGLLVAVGLGIPLGVFSAARPKSTLNRVITISLATLISIPNFVLGLLSIIVFASWLKIIRVLPDWNIPGHWIIPIFVLAVMPTASIARVTQATLMNILHEDYIRTAHAKGLRLTRVILVHVMRNAVVPIITFLGPTLMEMFTGSLIVENLFSFPGFGREYWESVLSLDYPMIMGLTLIYATGILIVITLIEILCAVLDPRIRFLQQQGAP